MNIILMNADPIVVTKILFSFQTIFNTATLCLILFFIINACQFDYYLNEYLKTITKASSKIELEYLGTAIVSSILGWCTIIIVFLGFLISIIFLEFNRQNLKNSQSFYSSVKQSFKTIGNNLSSQIHTVAKIGAILAIFFFIFVFIACMVGISTVLSFKSKAATNASNASLCSPGTYYDSNQKCSPCPAGEYCPDGTKTISCYNYFKDGSATFCPTGSSLPIKCPAKSYCADSTQIASCNLGNYCPEGSNSELPCSPGYYCPTTDTQLPCQAGYYCSGTTTTMTKCDIGNYCPTGTSYQSPCPAGSWCPTPDVQNKCNTPGDYCPSNFISGSTSETQCPAGNYCSTSTNIQTCPSGSYCPPGSQNPILCNTPGSYCQLGSSSESQCPAGNYCPNSSTKIQCSTTGDYCPPGSTLETKCPAGSWCPNSTILNACALGYYCPTGSTVENVCPIGNVCPANSQSPIKCPAGYFCPQSGMSEPTICPAGYFCPAGATSPSGCPSSSGTTCSQGSMGYQISTASDNSRWVETIFPNCPSGFYCPDGTPSSAIICPTGHYCWNDISWPTICPTGNPYSPIGSSLPSQCSSNN